MVAWRLGRFGDGYALGWGRLERIIPRYSLDTNLFIVDRSLFRDDVASRLAIPITGPGSPFRKTHILSSTLHRTSTVL